MFLPWNIGKLGIICLSDRYYWLTSGHLLLKVVKSVFSPLCGIHRTFVYLVDAYTSVSLPSIYEENIKFKWYNSIWGMLSLFKCINWGIQQQNFVLAWVGATTALLFLGNLEFQKWGIKKKNLQSKLKKPGIKCLEKYADLVVMHTIIFFFHMGMTQLKLYYKYMFQVVPDPRLALPPWNL